MPPKKDKKQPKKKQPPKQPKISNAYRRNNSGGGQAVNVPVFLPQAMHRPYDYMVGQIQPIGGLPLTAFQQAAGQMMNGMSGNPVVAPRPPDDPPATPPPAPPGIPPGPPAPPAAGFSVQDALNLPFPPTRLPTPTASVGTGTQVDTASRGIQTDERFADYEAFQRQYEQALQALQEQYQQRNALQQQLTLGQQQFEQVGQQLALLDSERNRIMDEGRNLLQQRNDMMALLRAQQESMRDLRRQNRGLLNTLQIGIPRFGPWTQAPQGLPGSGPLGPALPRVQPDQISEPTSSYTGPRAPAAPILAGNEVGPALPRFQPDQISLATDAQSSMTNYGLPAGQQFLPLPPTASIDSTADSRPNRRRRPN